LETRVIHDFRAMRLTMVESQIRPNGVRDPAILNAFATLPREKFVPDEQSSLAYMDEALPVYRGAGSSRTLLPPMVLARLLQFAAPSRKDHALDVGGVTGYSAAILADICATVDALEASDELAASMKQYLRKAGIGGISVHSGPLNRGLDALKPFDLILINGGVQEEPKMLFEQLAEGGRLVAIVRKGWLGHGCLFSKSAGVVSGRAIFDAGVDVLPGFEAAPHFVF
jgi:protein-L-isoaspartate(D-aspartate) O-methyltransferase